MKSRGGYCKRRAVEVGKTKRNTHVAYCIVKCDAAFVSRCYYLQHVLCLVTCPSYTQLTNDCKHLM